MKEYALLLLYAILSATFASSEFNVTQIIPAGSYPPPLNGHIAISYNGKMYVFGGCAESGICYNVLYCFNPSLNSWNIEQTTTTPSAREGHAAALISSEVVYVYGGVNKDGTLSDMYSLNLSTVFHTVSDVKLENMDND